MNSSYFSKTNYEWRIIKWNNCLIARNAPEYTYEDGELLICPECAHEWTVDATNENGGDEKIVKDSNGNVLASGDTVILIKDLKVKGKLSDLKKGTKQTSGHH